MTKDKSANIINSILDKIQTLRISPNQYLFKEGDKSNMFYIVKQGVFEMYREGSESDKKMLKTYDTFGEMALLELKRRSYTVRCKEGGIVYALEGKIFQEIVRKISQKELRDRLSFIALVPLFNSINSVQLNSIALSMLKLDFDENDNIIHEGDVGDSLYIILEGEVNCIKDRSLTRVLKSKDFFGEFGLIFDIPRSMSIYAKTKVICYQLSSTLLSETLGVDYRNIILKSIIKEALCSSSTLNIFSSDTYINAIFKNSEIKLYRDNEIIIPQYKLKMIGKSQIINNFLQYEPQSPLTSHSFNLQPNSNNINEEDKYFYILIAGNFVTADGKVVAKRGQLFSEELLNESKKSKVNIHAQGDCHVIELTMSYLVRLLNIQSTLKKLKTYSFFTQLNYMKKTAFFRNASDQLLLKVCMLMSEEKFTKKQIIVREGELGDKFYLIKSGKVNVIKNGKFVRQMEEGGAFGELSLLINEPRSATIECANDDVVTYVLTKKAFHDVMDKNILAYLQKRVSLFDNFNSTLSDFVFVKTLGKGKFGNVSLVHNGSNLYAIKAVRREAAERHKILIKYFREERRVLLKLDHPFIMKLVRTFKNETYIFFLTEFIDGMSLGKYLYTKTQSQFLNKYETQFYIAFLLIVLDYLNARCIVHRDLKPDNIVIDTTGYLKVIDFGSAFTIKNFTSTITGTPHYIAPEVLMGKGYSYSCDYWSVGIIAHEIFYNYFPFGNEATEPMEIYKEVIKKEVTLPSRGDATVNSFISYLLKKKVNERLCSLDMAKKHAFYKDFVWEDLIDFHLEPPFVPKETHTSKLSEYRTKYIDFLKEEENKVKINDDTKKHNKYNNDSKDYSDDDDAVSYPKDWVDEF